MNFLKLFGSKKGMSDEKALLLADERLLEISHLLSESTATKDKKMMRQVELWSLDTTQPDLEAEYKEVASVVATMARQILTLENARDSLVLEKSHCVRNGDCELLKATLSVPLSVGEAHPTLSKTPNLTTA